MKLIYWQVVDSDVLSETDILAGGLRVMCRVKLIYRQIVESDVLSETDILAGCWE